MSAPKVTERMMLDALARRFTARSQGVGERWIRAEHVRNGTGFDGWSEEHGRCVGRLRTADFIAIDTWESAGLPTGWGLLVPQTMPEWADADGWHPFLRVNKQAPRNRERKPLPFPMQVGLMRAVQKTATERSAA